MKTKVTVMISSFILFAVIANDKGAFNTARWKRVHKWPSKNLIALLSWINQSLPM